MGLLRQYCGGNIYPPYGICEDCWNLHKIKVKATHVAVKVKHNGPRFMTLDGKDLPETYEVCEAHAKVAAAEGWPIHIIGIQDILMRP